MEKWGVACALAVGFIAGAAAGWYGYWMLIPAVLIGVALFVPAAWRRIQVQYAAVTVTPNLILIALPTVLASTVISPHASAAALAALGVAGFLMKAGVGWAWPGLVLPVIGLAVALRPNYPATTLSVAIFVLATIVVVRAVHISDSRVAAIVSLADGVAVFLIASVVLRFALHTPDVDGRAAFPLTDALAATPDVAAVYVAAAAPILVTIRNFRIPRLIASGVAVYVLVLGDRRAALIGGLIIAACVLLAPRLFRRLAPWLVGAALITPFIYTSIQGAVRTPAMLLRRGEDPESLNGRDFVWSRAIQFYLHKVDDVHQAFGYGSFGQKASGVSGSYSGMFGDLYSGYYHRQLLTPHNSVLQMLFDGGWVFTGVFVAVIVWMAVVLSRTDVAGLAILAALAVVGTTEVALSATNPQPCWWVLVALGVAVFSRDRSDLRAASSPVSAAMR